MKSLYVLFIVFLSINSYSQLDMTTIDDVCEDDAPFTIAPITPSNSNSGFAGIAIFMITPDQVTNAHVDFSLQDFDGNYFMNETNIPNITYPLQPNSLYMLYDNPCFDINDAGSTPMNLWITDDIPQSSSVIDGCGYYIYYYACDAIEVINNRSSTFVSGDPSTYQGYYYDPSDPNNLGNVPSFYTANTSKRLETIWTTSSKKIIIPDPSTHQYFGYGEWSGTGITSVGSSTKDYFIPFPGLATTATIPSGEAQFDPSAAPIGPNLPQTFTYNSVMGVNGPAPCNVETITTTELDVHALPTITPLNDQLCNGATYDVTIDVDLDTYNVSVDEDGGTPFNVNGTGGTVSPTTLTGTGVHQVTITGIPTGSPWSLDVNDVTGLNCGLTGTNGSCITVLPIELIHFSGEKIDRNNLLFWETAAEIDNDYFIVEKSINGINFEAMPGIVDGAGNSTQQLSYSKWDYSPFLTTYYRLMQVDFNGQYSYSNVIVLGRDLENGDISIYPNPIKDDMTIVVNKASNKNINVTIVNSIGQLVLEKEIVNKNMQKQHTVSINNHSSGVYVVSIQTETKVYTKRVVKL